MRSFWGGVEGWNDGWMDVYVLFVTDEWSCRFGGDVGAWMWRRGGWGVVGTQPAQP